VRANVGGDISREVYALCITLVVYREWVRLEQIQLHSGNVVSRYFNILPHRNNIPRGRMVAITVSFPFSLSQNMALHATDGYIPPIDFHTRPL